MSSLGQISCFMFQWAGLFFRWGELHFEVGGVPHGGHWFCWEGFEKNPRMGWGGAPTPPTMGNLATSPSLIIMHKQFRGTLCLCDYVIM